MTTAYLEFSPALLTHVISGSENIALACNIKSREEVAVGNHFTMRGDHHMKHMRWDKRWGWQVAKAGLHALAIYSYHDVWYELGYEASLDSMFVFDDVFACSLSTREEVVIIQDKELAFMAGAAKVDSYASAFSYFIYE